MEFINVYVRTYNQSIFLKKKNESWNLLLVQIINVKIINYNKLVLILN